jgi:hypothetical protein
VPSVTTDYAWYPVRCCCQPTKIFGFLRLPIGSARPVVLDLNGARHEIEVKTISEKIIDCPEGLPPNEISRADERAIYSDDRPLAFWRGIPGFVEVADSDVVAERCAALNRLAVG